MLSLWSMGHGCAHVGTSRAIPGLKQADLVLEFLNVQDRLLKDLQLELLFLPLLVLARLLRVGGFNLIVLLVLVCAIIPGYGEFSPGIGRHEIAQHREGIVYLCTPGFFDARMILATHGFACST
jgi:hypothetical protein